MSDREPPTDNSSATDGNIASNNDVPKSREASDGSGSSTEARNNRDSNRVASNSAGGTSNRAGSSGSTGPSSVGDTRLRDSGNNNGGQPPAPLTRDDITVLVREFTRQLRSDSTEDHPPLVLGT